MKLRNKKGFTIVELVIVIAVVAILAAVLIPTFAGLVEKANLSADEQAVRQMNTALAMYTAEHGEPKSATEVKKALDENLVNTESMIPVTQGYAFYWNPEKNEIVLVGDGKGTAQDAWALLTSTGYGKEPDTAVVDADTFKQAVNQSSVSNPVLIKLESDLTVDKLIQIDTGKSVILDMNGKTITREGANYYIFCVYGGTLTVKNATIETGVAVYAKDGANVTLRNVKIDCNGAFAVRAEGLSSISIYDSEIKATAGRAIDSNSHDSENDGSRIRIYNSKVESTTATGIFMPIYADVSIDNCEIIGNRYGAFFRGCNAKITNSKVYNTGEDGTKEGGGWSTGDNGWYADIVFACGTGSDGYIATGSYECENVTGNGSEFAVVVHEPEGGNVNVSGITVTHECHSNDCTDAFHK